VQAEETLAPLSLASKFKGSASLSSIQVQRFDRMRPLQRIGPIAPHGEHFPRASPKQSPLLL
jgi:hypothetical protein